MVISSPAERSGECLSRSINSLPLVSEIDSACDFGNEKSGHLVLAVSFVNTEEVDFAHLDLFLLNKHSHRHSRDRSNQL